MLKRHLIHARKRLVIQPDASNLRTGATRVTSLCCVLLGATIVACSNGQNHVEPPLPPLPPIRSVEGGRGDSTLGVGEFSAIVDELRGIVNLLDRTPPLSQGEGLRRAFDRLIAAIESIPGPPQPARVEAARLMRARDFDVWVSLSREEATASAVRESLAVATGALAIAADGPYATPAVKNALQRLKTAVDGLSPKEKLRDQRPQVLTALHAALEVLTAIRTAAPGIAARDAG
jgi:hypothetical protein